MVNEALTPHRKMRRAVVLGGHPHDGAKVVAAKPLEASKCPLVKK
jgi:hypothetical protein